MIREPKDREIADLKYKLRADGYHEPYEQALMNEIRFQEADECLHRHIQKRLKIDQEGDI